MPVELEHVEEHVKQTVAQRLKCDPETISMEASFVHDLALDSLDTVDLIMDLEEKFGTEISDDEAKQLTTVREVVTFIRKRLSE